MFSNRTIQAIVNAVGFTTNNEFSDFIVRFELSEDIGGVSIAKKQSALVNFLIKNPEAKGPDNASLAIEIIEYIINKNRKYYSRSANSLMQELENALKKDGYELTETSVRKALPEEIPVDKTENKLIEILNKHGFSTAKGHYIQAIASHGRGDWAASNAQLRTFTEDFFDQVHKKLQAGNGANSHQRRQELANAGLFRAEFNEFTGNGTGFVEGFWKRLHPEGSHPGLSEEPDATFRLHLVLVVIHYYAERFDSIYGNL
ncbi:hypothetical protein [Pantoea septica]|uniref:hypothetical protein n=1 Tax=Pantoea septica TaxID=472695 RepID=UPI0025F3BA1D|nr:hypothetical protein [Pantoea septica]